jgi:peptidoglycan hydrolase CwlO-like protein
MNHLAILELESWSEIAALISIITVVWGVLSGVLVMWLGTKFVNKKSYYAGKDESDTSREAMDSRVAKIEREMAMANAPLAAVQSAVNEMKNQLEKLTGAVGTMKDEIGKAIHDIDKRTVVLESKSRRGGGGGR